MLSLVSSMPIAAESSLTHRFSGGAIFNSYNSIGSKWHNWDPHPELLAEMPPMRQTMFRPVYVGGNVVREAVESSSPGV